MYNIIVLNEMLFTDPVKIFNFQSEHYVAVQQSVTLNCQAEGNPRPSYTWTPCYPGQVCDKSTLVISQVLDDGVYTCKVANDFSSDAKDTSVCKLVNVLTA